MQQWKARRSRRKVFLMIYTVVLKKMPLLFYDIFNKYGSIVIILSLLRSQMNSRRSYNSIYLSTRCALDMTGNVLLVWSVSRCCLNMQPSNVELADMLLRKQPQPILSVWQNLCLGLRSLQLLRTAQLHDTIPTVKGQTSKVTSLTSETYTYVG